MTTAVRTIVAGIFKTRAEGEQAVQALQEAGFNARQIGLASRPDQTPSAHTQAAEGAAGGALAGGALGTLAGLAVATHLIPPLGPVLAGGMLAGLLASATTGAVAGSLVGALVGLGIPEERARRYESAFVAGRTLVTVQADEHCDQAFAILIHHGAYDIEARGCGTEA
jgi:hypothetical protein